MNVLVVGGCGAMGQAVALDLVKQEQVKKVVLGDISIDPERLREKLRANGKASLAKVDVNDHDGLVKAIRGADIVINCAGPFYKTAVAVAGAAVEAGVNYIDICDDYEAVKILFASDIDAAAKKAGITVLDGNGFGSRDEQCDSQMVCGPSGPSRRGQPLLGGKHRRSLGRRCLGPQPSHDHR